MAKAPPYVYAKLTWPEVNEAVAAGKVPVIPVGSIEQHGPHLPLDVDCVCPTGVAYAAAERAPERILREERGWGERAFPTSVLAPSVATR